ncbi:hypothetical protein GWM83_00370, partial [Candidatus Bathyarchaeota archaeon]|nr:hypothetical protein [Candidatus Bathyarchaeota archaeon]NIR13461.1 hypothetical protein [Desulfobacterales bacterium]NIW34011.1 hypothetical protein [Candidatus Bathyarchaeota archaeon]
VNTILAALNVYPLLFKQGKQDFGNIFSVSLDLNSEYNGYGNKIMSLTNLAYNSLLAFNRLRKEPEVAKEVLEAQVAYYEYFVSVFTSRLARISKIAKHYPSFILDTARSIALALCCNFEYAASNAFSSITGRRSKFTKLTDQVEVALNRVGTNSPLILPKSGRPFLLMSEKVPDAIVEVGRNGSVFARLPAEVPKSHDMTFIGPHPWLDLFFVKSVLRWMLDLEYLECPLYRFFTERIGGDQGKGRNFLKIAVDGPLLYCIASVRLIS